MQITKHKFPGVCILEPKVFEDKRGLFFESYNEEVFRQLRIDVAFVQDNHSRSKEGVLRGLHYQVPPYAQDKLVRVLRGAVYDVIVDIRSGSPTFGQWAGVWLSEQNRRMLFVPKGFAHGFCVVHGCAEVHYKCSNLYAPEFARGIRWDDDELKIKWPLDNPVLSEQDAQHPFFADISQDFLFQALD